MLSPSSQPLHFSVSVTFSFRSVSDLQLTSMASANEEIEFEFPPHVRLYKNGRFERVTVVHKPPSPCDPVTGVASKDVIIDPATPVSARLYLPTMPSPPLKLPLLVYFHGGAFCFESAISTTYHSYLNSVATLAGVLIVSVEYRLAPENPLPAAYDDCWAALRWALAESDPWISEHADITRVFLAGDSAGANIAHRMAVLAGAEGEVRVEGTALFHPFFSTGAEVLEGTLTNSVWRLVCPGSQDGSADPRLNPAAEKEAVKGMAGRRLVVFVAEKDGLRNRGKAYYELVKGSGWGGTAELVESEGEGHIFHLINPKSEKAVEVMENFVAFLKAA